MAWWLHPSSVFGSVLIWLWIQHLEPPTEARLGRSVLVLKALWMLFLKIAAAPRAPPCWRESLPLL